MTPDKFGSWQGNADPGVMRELLIEAIGALAEITDRPRVQVTIEFVDDEHLERHLRGRGFDVSAPPRKRRLFGTSSSGELCAAVSLPVDTDVLAETLAVAWDPHWITSSVVCRLQPPEGQPSSHHHLDEGPVLRSIDRDCVDVEWASTLSHARPQLLERLTARGEEHGLTLRMTG